LRAFQPLGVALKDLADDGRLGRVDFEELAFGVERPG